MPLLLNKSKTTPDADLEINIGAIEMLLIVYNTHLKGNVRIRFRKHYPTVFSLCFQVQRTDTFASKLKQTEWVAVLDRPNGDADQSNLILAHTIMLNNKHVRHATGCICICHPPSLPRHTLLSSPLFNIVRWMMTDWLDRDRIARSCSTRSNVVALVWQ
jgi:hypothetical protein